MKNLGLLLVVIGVGLAAAFGSQLHQDVKSKAELSGRLELLVRDAGAAKSSYCALSPDQPAAQQTQLSDHCPPKPVVKKAPTKAAKAAKAADVDTARRKWVAAVETAKAIAETPVEVTLKVLTRPQPGVEVPPVWTEVTLGQSHTDLAVACTIASGPQAGIQMRNPKDKRFFVRAKLADDPKAEALQEVGIWCLTVDLGANVAATERLGGWFKQAGIPFIIGFLLICIGGIVARRAVKAELLASVDGTGAGGPARDFGELLAETRQGLQALVDGLKASDGSPTEGDLADTLAVIEAIQGDAIARIIETREQLILRFGMSGFAEIFGPFSGAERYLNRSWSAFVDRYWEEGMTSLNIAVSRFGDTEEALKQQLDALKG